MKKFNYLLLPFLLTLLFSVSFTSCDKNDDDGGETGATILGSVSVGDDTINLVSGVASYYGEATDSSYNTDLTLLTVSNEQISAIEALENDNSITTEEEYVTELENILGDSTLGGFYIEAFSDVVEMLSEGTYEQALNYNAFTYTYAEVFWADTYYEVFGELEVIQSSKNYYEVEFSGTTEDGEVVELAFEGGMLYQDFSDESFFSVAKNVIIKGKNQFSNKK